MSHPTMTVWVYRPAGQLGLTWSVGDPGLSPKAALLLFAGVTTTTAGRKKMKVGRKQLLIKQVRGSLHLAGQSWIR